MRIIIALLLILAAPCFAQTKGASDTEKVMQRIDAASEKLGVAVEHLWEATVKQQRMGAAAACTVHLLVYIVSGFLMIGVVRSRRRNGGRWITLVNNDLTGWGVCFVVIIAAFAINSGVFLIEASTYYTKLTNPEFHAAQDIARMLRK